MGGITATYDQYNDDNTCVQMTYTKNDTQLDTCDDLLEVIADQLPDGADGTEEDELLDAYADFFDSECVASDGEFVQITGCTSSSSSSGMSNGAIAGIVIAAVAVPLLAVLVYVNRGRIGEWRQNRGGETVTEDASLL